MDVTTYRCGHYHVVNCVVSSAETSCNPCGYLFEGQDCCYPYCAVEHYECKNELEALELGIALAKAGKKISISIDMVVKGVGKNDA